MAQIQIIQYSERSIVIAGDTKPIKDMLKQAGGKFNPRLTHPKTHTSLMGWIFSKSRETALLSMLSGNGVKYERETPDNINSGNHRDYIQDPAEIDADNFCQRNNI